MRLFLLNIVSSVIGGLILSSVVFMLAKNFKKNLKITLNKFLGSGITYIYPNQESAVADIKKSFKKSETIKILTIRGCSFINNHGSLNFLIKDLKSHQKLQFLLGDGVSKNSNYITERATELNELDDQNIDDFLGELKLHYETLQNIEKDKIGFTFRLHNSPVVFRLIIFNNEIYILFYSNHSRAKNNQVYRYSFDYEMYKAFNRYFDKLWNASKKHI